MKIFKRFIDPITFRVNFRDSYWHISRLGACMWLSAAIVAGVLAQALVGYLNPLTVLLTLVMPVILMIQAPPRLGGAIAGMLIVQAFGSVGVIYGLAYLGQPYIVREAGGMIWSLLCGAAYLAMLLRYVRTPRKEMAEASALGAK